MALDLLVVWPITKKKLLTRTRTTPVQPNFPAGPSGFYQIDTSFPGRTYYSTAYVIGWTTPTSPTYVNYNFYTWNRTPYNITFRLHPSANVVYGSRVEAQSLFMVDINSVDYVPSPAPEIALSSSEAAWVDLQLDPATNILWAVGNLGTTVVKVGWNRASDTANRVLTTRSLGTTNCYSLFFSSSTVYFGCFGTILASPRSNIAIDGGTFAPSLVTSYSVGAGQYQAGVIDNAAQRLYLGSTIGLGIEFDTSSNSLLRIFFLQGQTGLAPLRSAYLDRSGVAPGKSPVIFWGTSDGRVVRVNTRDYSNVFSQAYVGFNTDFHAMAYDNSTRTLVLGNGIVPGSTSHITYSATLTDCSIYSCSQCLTIDQEYCGVCLDTGSCSQRAECSAGNWKNEAICPVPLSISPSSGSVTGQTSVTYQGTAFESTPGVHKCRWTQSGSGAVTNDPLATSPNSITCASPSSFSTGQASLSILYVSGSISREYSASQSFTFYDCTTVSSCSSCLSTSFSECGWCFASASCMSTSSTCATSSNTPGAFLTTGGTCPATTSTNPLHVSALGQDTITVSTKSFVPSASGYKCSYGSYGSSAATGNSDSSDYTCQAIALPALTLGPSNPTANVSVGLVDASSNLKLTVSETAVTYYNCSAFSKCSDCREYPRCAWCGLDRRCIFTGQETCNSGPVSLSCPAVSSVVPPSTQVVDSANLQITVLGSNLESSSSLNCFFRMVNPPQTLYQSPATFHNASNITCSTPVSGLSHGEWQVGLGTNGVLDTNTVSLLSYDCSISTSCDDCMDPLRVACHWCRDLDKLVCSNAIDPSCSNEVIHTGTCPKIDLLDPSSLLLTANVSVALIGDHKVENVTASTSTTDLADLQCAYNIPGKGVTYTSVTFRNESQLICTTSPATSNATIASLQLVNSALRQYSKAISLPYIDCSLQTTCNTCLDSNLGCHWCGDSCSTSCPVNTPNRGCPRLIAAEPDHASILGGDSIYVRGENLLFFASKKRESPYICDWGGVRLPGISVSSELIQCPTPSQATDTNITLNVLLNNIPYLGPMPIAFFSCGLNNVDYCSDTCLDSHKYCGWCIGDSTCGSEAKCGNLWQGSCVSASLFPLISNLAGGDLISATLSSPLPNTLLQTDLKCSFGDIVVPANFTPQGSIVTCAAPASTLASQVPFQIYYQSKKYSIPTAFTYVDCSSNKNCGSCVQSTSCGWCSSTKQCTLQQHCAKSWSRNKCPVNALALGLGLGLGLFFLILLLGVMAFLIRRARRRQGLIIALKEPDYMAIAFGNDIHAMWRIPEHNYRLLDTALSRRDFLLQLAIGFNCPATEQDALAKALVYVACSHDVAAEMIQTCIRAEIQACLHENTLFRNNSVASRMYKFYSRIVGIKYLFHCIARVILELEVLGRETLTNQEQHRNHSSSGTNGNSGSGKGSKGKDNILGETSNSTSLLSLSMELDQTKALDDDMDTETNLLQLQLICQKLLNVLIKTSVKNIPAPFRKIFIEIDNSVMGKFAGSHDAVYKGIGGLFFLRFVCPAITAPHVYGLLEHAPNTVTQRQLVLISKVIQSIANMQPPGKKEEYMAALTDFIVSAIPRIVKFYDNLRQAVNMPETQESQALNMEVPLQVHQNGLCTVWNFLWTEKDKIKTWADSEQSPFDHSQKVDIVGMIDDCVAQYPGAPKKIKTIGTTVPEGKEPRKKKKKQTT